MEKTKIIATIGPASEDRSILKQMVRKGFDICRLNFPFGTPDIQRARIKTIRELNKETGLQVGLMLKRAR